MWCTPTYHPPRRVSFLNLSTVLGLPIRREIPLLWDYFTFPTYITKTVTTAKDPHVTETKGDASMSLYI